MSVVAGVQGIVVELLVAPGAPVSEGEDLLVIESMKLEYVVKCPAAGRVSEVLVAVDDSVGEDTVVLTLAA
jgi:biotin carboxyl carrier protein